MEQRQVWDYGYSLDLKTNHQYMMFKKNISINHRDPEKNCTQLFNIINIKKYKFNTYY